MLLEIKEITAHYGKSMAIEDVSLDVREGSIVSIIGANGAGKSTTLKAISRMVPVAKTSRMTFKNKNLLNSQVE